MNLDGLSLSETCLEVGLVEVDKLSGKLGHLELSLVVLLSSLLNALCVRLHSVSLQVLKTLLHQLFFWLHEYSVGVSYDNLSKPDESLRLHCSTDLPWPRTILIDLLVQSVLVIGIVLPVVFGLGFGCSLLRRCIWVLLYSCLLAPDRT